MAGLYRPSREFVQLDILDLFQKRRDSADLWQALPVVRKKFMQPSLPSGIDNVIHREQREPLSYADLKDAGDAIAVCEFHQISDP